MKKIFLLLSITVVLVFFSGCGKKQDDADIDKSFLTSREKMESYVLGHDIANMLKSAGDHINEFSEIYFWKGFENTINYRDIGADLDEIVAVFSDADSIAYKMDKINVEGISDKKNKQSYIIGVYHAEGISRFPEVFDMTSFRSGFKNEFEGKPSLLSQEEMDGVRSRSLKYVEKLHRNADINVSKEEKAEINREFLIENAKREKVKTLPSGLQYAVMKEGNGKGVTGTENVKVNYRAYFIDGREFDSSYKKGAPAQFSLNDDILPGWKEGIKLMKEGSRYKLFLPPELAYGKEGFNEIPPNSVLIFDIELLNITD
jgi:FKBP-type peptidyl-prolyl cis-trans isomerase FklB